MCLRQTYAYTERRAFLRQICNKPWRTMMSRCLIGAVTINTPPLDMVLTSDVLPVMVEHLQPAFSTICECFPDVQGQSCGSTPRRILHHHQRPMRPAADATQHILKQRCGGSSVTQSGKGGWRTKGTARWLHSCPAMRESTFVHIIHANINTFPLTNTIDNTEASTSRGSDPLCALRLTHTTDRQLHRGPCHQCSDAWPT
jgi:hypothetical protein